MLKQSRPMKRLSYWESYITPNFHLPLTSIDLSVKHTGCFFVLLRYIRILFFLFYILAVLFEIAVIFTTHASKQYNVSSLNTLANSFQMPNVQLARFDLLTLLLRRKCFDVMIACKIINNLIDWPNLHRNLN